MTAIPTIVPTPEQLRLQHIQESVHLLFRAMEHLDLDTLFLAAGTENTVPRVKIDNALRRDAEWLTALLGIPEQSEDVIRVFNTETIKR